MKFQILFLMTSKNELILKKHCHPYKKFDSSEFYVKSIFIDLLTGKNLPST